MRLVPTFFLVSLFSFFIPSIATAVANHKPDSRVSRTIAARQHQPKRALLDTCAYIDLGLDLPDILGLELKLKLCLCLSAFPLQLGLNTELDAIIEALGTKLATDLLLGLISGHGQQCHYPPHSQPVCKSGDPCGFECVDGYTKDGKTCVCPRPMVECRGKCTTSCPSMVSRATNRRSIAVKSFDTHISQGSLPKMVKKRRGAHSLSRNAEPDISTLSLGSATYGTIDTDTLRLTSISVLDDSPALGTRDVVSPLLSGLYIPGLTSSSDHGGSAILDATQKLVKDTTKLYADLPSISATAEDDSTTLLIKTTIGTTSQACISSVVILVNNSKTTKDLILNTYAILRSCKLLETSLATLSGDGPLIQDTENLLQDTLDLLNLCDPHANPHSPPSPSSVPGPASTASGHTVAAPPPSTTSSVPSASSNDPVFVDLSPLLADLGLGGIDIKTALDVDGLLGTQGSNELTNDILASLDLGGRPPASGPAESSPRPPMPSSRTTLLGLDLNGLLTSLIDLNFVINSTSSLTLSSSYADSLSSLQHVANYADLMSSLTDINNALLADTWKYTEDLYAASIAAVQDSVKILHDLDGCGCANHNDTMTPLLGLVQSSLLGNSDKLLVIDYSL